MNETRPSSLRRFTLAAVCLAAALGLALPVSAGSPPDHLGCYNLIFSNDAPDLVKPIGSLAPSSVDSPSPSLTSLTGCNIANTVRAFCTPTTKLIGGSSQQTGPELFDEYTCYQLLCPDQPDRTIAVNDQFGSRQVTIRNTRWLCAPADRGRDTQD